MSRSSGPADLAQFGIFPGPGRPLEVRFRREANYENPYTQQASLGIQRDLGAGFATVKRDSAWSITPSSTTTRI